MLTESCLSLQVSTSPLRVAVQHLKDLPYDGNDDIVKATTMELISTLKVSCRSWSHA